MFFVNKLDKEKLIDILNCCLDTKAHNEKRILLDSEFIYECVIDDKIVFDKENNEALFLICKNEQGNVLYSLVVSDFSLYSPDITKLLDLTEEFKESMAIRFGQDYIESLYAHKLKNASEEYTNLALILEKKNKGFN